jgi:hypothetical protein
LLRFPRCQVRVRHGNYELFELFPMHDEKRLSQRLMKSIEVECRTIDAYRLSVPVRISDLSRSGAFLDTVNPLPVGTRLGLRFALRDYLFIVTAEVVHQMPQFGMGVRFLNLSPEGKAMLEGVLRSEA